MGGSLDAVGLSPEGWYIMRGFRMFEKKVYSCTFDLMSFIPSLENPNITILDEFNAFNSKVKICSKSRLIENGKIIDAKPLQLCLKDRLSLLMLLVRSERSLGKKQIDEYFTQSLFQSDFWYEFATTFSFQPWHSIAEFRRYLLRFLQDAPIINTAECIQNTRYNQYDSIVLPIVKWLKKQNVNFQTDCTVTDISFKIKDNKKFAESITYIKNGEESKITVNTEDKTLITLGSMSANSMLGSMDCAPSYLPTQSHASWNLWKNIAENQSEFGNPSIFTSQPDKTKWSSFTLTFRSSLFLDLMEKFTWKKAGEGGGLVTIKDSNWLLTIGIPSQPHFIGQSSDISVCWGYGLFSDKEGNFVRKKMSECTGEEILTELCKHLRFDEHLEKIRKTAVCIPCMMPYITSQFLPRKQNDRPRIIPKKSANFALIGQYCEIPRDMVFTVEYSVRSAQIAVYSLFKLKKKITPMYHGRLHPKVVWNAIRTAFR